MSVNRYLSLLLFAKKIYTSFSLGIFLRAAVSAAVRLENIYSSFTHVDTCSCCCFYFPIVEMIKYSLYTRERSKKHRICVKKKMRKIFIALLHKVCLLLFLILFFLLYLTLLSTHCGGNFLKENNLVLWKYYIIFVLLLVQ